MLVIFFLCKPFSSILWKFPLVLTPGIFVHIISYWHNLLKTFFQQNSNLSPPKMCLFIWGFWFFLFLFFFKVLCPPKINILILTSLCVGHTFECQLGNFQTWPCSNQTEPISCYFRTWAATGRSYHRRKVRSRLKQVKVLCWRSKMVAYFQGKR